MSMRDILRELIAQISQFENRSKDWSRLNRVPPNDALSVYLREHPDEHERLADLTNSTEITINTYIMLARFKSRLQFYEMAIDVQFPHNVDQLTKTRETVTEASKAFSGYDAETQARVAGMMDRYKLDFIRTAKNNNVHLVYDQEQASTSTASCWSKNRDLLVERGIISEFADQTYLRELNFDARKLLSFDDYRTFILQRYFVDMKRSLRMDDAGPQPKDLVPFDLLFSPRLELHYSPSTLAWLWMRDDLLSNISRTITLMRNRISEQIGEIRLHIDRAYDRAVTLERANVALTGEIQDSQLRRIEKENAQSVVGQKKKLEEQLQRRDKITRVLKDTKEEIEQLKEANKWLANFDRIGEFFTLQEKRFLANRLASVNGAMQPEQYVLQDEAYPVMLSKDREKVEELVGIERAYGKYRLLWANYLDAILELSRTQRPT